MYVIIIKKLTPVFIFNMISVTVGFSILIVYGTFIVLYFLMNRKQRSGRIYRATYVHLLICYALCLTAFVFLPAKTSGGQNFIPLINFLKNTKDGRIFELKHFLDYNFNMFLNAFLFVPLGFFCAVYARLNCVRKPCLIAFAFGAVLSVAIELLQWALPLKRITDIDHVIFNALGAVLGAVIFGRIQYRPFILNFLKALRLSKDVDEINS